MGREVREILENWKKLGEKRTGTTNLIWFGPPDSKSKRARATATLGLEFRLIMAWRRKEEEEGGRRNLDLVAKRKRNRVNFGGCSPHSCGGLHE